MTNREQPADLTIEQIAAERAMFIKRFTPLEPTWTFEDDGTGGFHHNGTEQAWQGWFAGAQRIAALASQGAPKAAEPPFCHYCNTGHAIDYDCEPGRRILARGAPKAEAPTGWKLVPLESTREMQKAAAEACGSDYIYARCYRTMVAAAPSAPKAEAPARNWPAVEKRAQEYIEEYEYDDGEGGCHSPSELERIVLLDALMGLLADDEFVAALAHAQRPAPEDEADSILRAIGLDPETYRTDGGALNLRKIKAAISHPSEYARSQVTEEMVGRFLCWRLPDNFAPDAGISFKRVYNETSPYGPSTREPRGTNLLNAEQARKMLEHVCASAQRPAPDPAAGVAPDSFSEWGEDDVSWAKEAAAQRPAGPATPVSVRERIARLPRFGETDVGLMAFADGPVVMRSEVLRILDEGKS